MATLDEIHTAIERRLRTIPGLQTRSHPPQGVKPPVAFVQMSRWETETMGRKNAVKLYEFSVVVATAQSVRPQDGYAALVNYADYAGNQSIELAIRDGNDFAAGTFDGLAATSAFVREFSVLGSAQIDAFEMYGGEFTVEVHTRGEA